MPSTSAVLVRLPSQRPSTFEMNRFLELPHGIFEMDALVDHLLDQPLQAVGNHQASSRPVRRRNASTYFSRVFSMTSSGREGTGGCLFQRMCSR